MIRSLVMLGGLVAVPAIALFGSGMTDSVKQLAQRHLGIQCGASSPALSEAPVFVPAAAASPVAPMAATMPLAPPQVSMPTAVPSASVPGVGLAPSWPPATVASMAPPAAATLFAPPGATSVAAPSAPVPPATTTLPPEVVQASTTAAPGANVVPAVGYENPRPAAVLPPMLRGATAESAVPTASSIYQGTTNMVPVPRAIPGGVEARGTDAVAGVSIASAQPRRMLPLQETSDTERSPMSATVGGPDRFKSEQLRLRQLGATYCLLESWGAGSELYRFHCRVGVDGSTNFTRSFEASDADPVGAMAKVAEQVEQWQSCRR